MALVVWYSQHDFFTSVLVYAELLTDRNVRSLEIQTFRYYASHPKSVT